MSELARRDEMSWTWRFPDGREVSGVARDDDAPWEDADRRFWRRVRWLIGAVGILAVLALAGGCQTLRPGETSNCEVVTLPFPHLRCDKAWAYPDPPPEDDPVEQERDASLCSRHDPGTPQHCGCMERHNLEGYSDYLPCRKQDPPAPVVPQSPSETAAGAERACAECDYSDHVHENEHADTVRAMDNYLRALTNLQDALRDAACLEDDSKNGGCAVHTDREGIGPVEAVTLPHGTLSAIQAWLEVR